MTKYVVVSNDTKPFLLGRYPTLERAQQAVDGRDDLWVIYQERTAREIIEKRLGHELPKTADLAPDQRRAIKTLGLRLLKR